jgi:hypothetical protein
MDLSRGVCLFACLRSSCGQSFCVVPCQHAAANSWPAFLAGSCISTMILPTCCVRMRLSPCALLGFFQDFPTCWVVDAVHGEVP